MSKPKRPTLKKMALQMWIEHIGGMCDLFQEYDFRDFHYPKEDLTQKQYDELHRHFWKIHSRIRKFLGNR